MPAVAGLKKQGASNGASLAFMVSTPENGIDSIALTYSLMDPIMTVMRPLAGFVSGSVAGILENIFERNSATTGAINNTVQNVDRGRGGIGMTPFSGMIKQPRLFFSELLKGQKYAFGTLFDDIAGWYLVGVILAGAITYIIPDDILVGAYSQGIISYMAMLILGLPIYVCATFSTPVAAAMIAKGLSPGAALVFLLTGPATNMATISMLLGLMGRRTVAVYLVSIVICSLGFAFLTDYIYLHFNISASSNIGLGQISSEPNFLEVFTSIIMMGLIVKSLLKRKW